MDKAQIYLGEIQTQIIFAKRAGFPIKAFLRAMDGHISRFHAEDYDLDALYSEVETIAGLLGIEE
jgi:hypothetical protein